MPKIPCIFVPAVTCLSKRLGLVSALIMQLLTLQTYIFTGTDIYIYRHLSHAYHKFGTTACTLPSAIHSPQISSIKSGSHHMRVGILKELKGAPLPLILVTACLSCFMSCLYVSQCLQSGIVCSFICIYCTT